MVGRGIACAAGAMMLVCTAVPASAQMFWKSPDFRGQPVQGTEAGVVIPLPGATASEVNANLVWTLRAGLNVAALQCQFAPSLMTVANYNQMLSHHGKELNTDYKTLQAYFRRKARSENEANGNFDRYTTSTYNSFSTLNGQRGFCQTAGSVGEQALMTPKGKLVATARERLRELRNSLAPNEDGINVRQQYAFADTAVPGYAPDCFDKKGRVKKRCL